MHSRYKFLVYRSLIMNATQNYTIKRHKCLPLSSPKTTLFGALTVFYNTRHADFFVVVWRLLYKKLKVPPVLHPVSQSVSSSIEDSFAKIGICSLLPFG